jgi:hypothetical protein
LRQIPTRYSESEIRRFVEETFKLFQFEEALNADPPTWQDPNIVNGDQIVLGGGPMCNNKTPLVINHFMWNLALLEVSIL